MLNSIKKSWNEIPVNPKTVREFGFILSGFFLLFPLFINLIKIIFVHKHFYYWFGWLFLSIGALVINLFVPAGMSFIYRIATFFSKGISWIMMRILLSILFYFVLTPLSITMRIFGKDFLDQKLDRDIQSYWIRRIPKPAREQYEKLF